MLKFKHEVYVLVVVLLSAALLFTAVGCKATEPAVSEATVAEPTVSAVPTEGNQQLSLSLPLPEDAQTGDLLVAQICCTGSDPVVAPALPDWTPILQTNSEGSLVTVSFYKVFEQESERDTPYIFRVDSTVAAGETLQAAGKIAWFRGIDVNNPLAGQCGGAGDGTKLLADGVDTEGACVLVTLFSASGSQELTLSGGTEQMNARYNEPVDGFVLCAAEQRGNAGASGSRSATAQQSGAWTTQMIALRMAPVEIVFRAGAHGTLTADKRDSVTVSAQDGLELASIPKVYANSGYDFVGWAVSSVAGTLDNTGVCALDLSDGATLTAIYRQRTYTVSFALGEHGTSADKLTFSGVHLGDSIGVPRVTAKSGWTFTGWNTTPATKVKGNAAYTAQYTQNSFTVTFDLGAHGRSKDTLDFTDLKSGDTIEIPSVHADAGWTFDGWNSTPVTSVTASAVYTAKYIQQEYTVTFDLGEHGSSAGKLVWTGLHLGDTITVPSVTTDEDWSFTGWDTTPVTSVDGSATYIAQYEETTYTVTFVLGTHGTSEDTLVFSDLHDGDTISVPNVTPDEHWFFDGWDVTPETSVHASATYTAVYSEETFTVTFVLGDHAYSEDQLEFTGVPYEGTITIPSFTLDVGYMLIGWSMTPSTTVTDDATYTLIYHAPPEK